MPGRLTLAVGLSCLAAVVTGCGDDPAREYAVPRDLCGVEVPPQRLAPFLPPGEKVRQREEDLGPGKRDCSLFVDGGEVMNVRHEWAGAATTGRDYARLAHVEPEQWTRDETRVYSSEGAVAVVDVDCAWADADEAPYVSVDLYGRGEPDQAAMGEFTDAYAEAITKPELCDL